MKAMDESITKECLAAAKYVPELTSYLGLELASGQVDHVFTEGSLDQNQIEDWIKEEGQFASRLKNEDRHGSFKLL
jgi:hypothetical protein